MLFNNEQRSSSEQLVEESGEQVLYVKDATYKTRPPRPLSNCLLLLLCLLGLVSVSTGNTLDVGQCISVAG